MNILIPARIGSKRIYRKNLQKIGEKTLLQITIEHAHEFGQPYVSSDSYDILDEAEKNGAIGILRAKHLCTDEAPTLPIWQEFVQNYPSEYTILMQCTSPFRNIMSLRSGVNTMISQKLDSGFSAIVYGGFVHTLKNGQLERCFPRVRTQEIQSKFVIEDGSMYVAKSSRLLEENDLFFGNPYILENDILLDIDNHRELDIARWIYGQR